MKFLCFPGAFTNAEVSAIPLGFYSRSLFVAGESMVDNPSMAIAEGQPGTQTFAIQLQPLMKELQQNGDEITFQFTQGSIPAPPSSRFNTFFGNPPHWRYIFVGGESSEEALEKHRNFVEQEDPEQSMRNGERSRDESTVESTIQSMENAMIQVRKTIVESGPFQGVIGYSEGAAMAATLLVEELQKAKKTGLPSTLKCGIFMAGAPAFRPEIGGYCLWDDVGEVINVPTCHVIGVADPYIHCALALHRTCDSEKAIIFDHGWGHTIPRDADIVQELALEIREMMADADRLEAETYSAMKTRVSDPVAVTVF